MFSTPVLFLVYKNPNVTLRTFEKIRELQPVNLYIAADGPKPSDDESECFALRERLLERIDWSCNLRTLFRPSNLGLKLAVSSALDWFFNQNHSGIILEYDCLPDISFFHFCETLLKRYEHDERIFSISGNNITCQHYQPTNSYSYFYSSFTPVWGWATWRRSWLLWQATLNHYHEFLQMRILDSRLNSSRSAVSFWKKNFDDVYFHRNTTTWAFCFNYYQLLNNSLCIVPRQNLVTNLGFGPQATHSISTNHPLANLPLFSVSELTHPAVVTPNIDYDIRFSKLASYIPFTLKCRLLLSNLKSIIKHLSFRP